MSDVSEAPPGLCDSAAPGDTVPDKMPAIAEASEVLPLLPSASLEICDLEGLGEDDTCSIDTCSQAGRPDKCLLMHTSLGGLMPDCT